MTVVQLTQEWSLRRSRRPADPRVSNKAPASATDEPVAQAHDRLLARAGDARVVGFDDLSGGERSWPAMGSRRRLYAAWRIRFEAD